MSDTELKKALREAQEHIAVTTTSRDGDQNLLEAIWQELSYVIDPDDDGDIDYDGLRERLVGAAEHFEAEHPELATRIREAVTILSTAGV